MAIIAKLFLSGIWYDAEEEEEEEDQKGDDSRSSADRDDTEGDVLENADYGVDYGNEEDEGMRARKMRMTKELKNEAIGNRISKAR